MNRKKIGKTKHKAPKFTDFKDEFLRWEEKLEMKQLRKKQKHKRIKFETEY